MWTIVKSLESGIGLHRWTVIGWRLIPTQLQHQEGGTESQSGRKSQFLMLPLESNVGAPQQDWLIHCTHMSPWWSPSPSTTVEEQKEVHLASYSDDWICEPTCFRSLIWSTLGKVVRKGNISEGLGSYMLSLVKSSLGHPCCHVTIGITLDSTVSMCPALALFPTGQMAQLPLRAHGTRIHSIRWIL